MAFYIELKVDWAWQTSYGTLMMGLVIRWSHSIIAVVLH